MLFNAHGRLDPEQEDAVAAAERAAVANLLGAGMDVIVDATHLTDAHRSCGLILQRRVSSTSVYASRCPAPAGSGGAVAGRGLACTVRVVRGDGGHAGGAISSRSAHEPLPTR
jgi:hypothetical protein